MKVSLEKRHKYLIQSLMFLALFYYFFILSGERGLSTVLFMLALVYISSYIAHRPNSNLLNMLITGILPAFLVVGVYLSLIFFPNLSQTFRILSLLMFTIIFYLISLVNNVFLVVESREEVIPLHRVAITWSKILMVVIAIPLLAGIFKMSLNPLLETALAGLVTLLFFIYLTWSLKYNQDVKKYNKGEIVSILGLGIFVVSLAGISVSFFPTETFLRAIFISSVLMFGVSYVEAHLKNVVNKRLITEHLIISVLFLILLFFFNP